MVKQINKIKKLDVQVNIVNLVKAIMVKVEVLIQYLDHQEWIKSF